MNNNEKIAKLYEELLILIGEDKQRDGLVKTPERAMSSLLYLTKGYTERLDDVLNEAVFESDNNGMVIVKEIEFYSLCEHHLVPFFGKCHVGYIPSGKVIGLSKIARIVDLFSRRLQIQENLTQQISHAIERATNALGVGVVIEAHHLCMMMRGVEKQNSSMLTSSMLGVFKTNLSTRSEFLNLIK